VHALHSNEKSDLRVVEPFRAFELPPFDRRTNPGMIGGHLIQLGGQIVFFSMLELISAIQYGKRLQG